jgi:hypothetical protein
MPAIIVRCHLPGCDTPAAYKIAATWSDGPRSELKSYGFACAEHLGPVFRAAEQRHHQYRPVAGETIQELGIYKFDSGKRDRLLQRLWGLEENYRS